MSEFALEVRNLTVQAREGHGKRAIVHDILADVSVRVRTGGAVGIVGESGSGKSTLIRAVMDLLPPAMQRTSGEYRLDGDELWARGRARSALGARVAYIPQDPLSALNPVLPIFDQVTEVIRLHSNRPLRALRESLRGYFWRVAPRRAELQATALLDRVGIPEPASRVRQFPHEFSGGMRQRVMIASALAGEPAVLLADEPTTALDASVERRILDLIAEIKAARHLSLVLVSHDLNVVAWMCEYAYVFYRGRIVEEGPVERLFRSPRHPYTRALVSATPGRVIHDDGLGPSVEVTGTDVANTLGGAASSGCAYRNRCSSAEADCAIGIPPLRRDADGAYACLHPLADAP